MLSHALKIERAYDHLKDLESRIEAWLDSDSYRVRVEPDPERSGYGILKADADDIPANPFSLLVGDVVQNLRGSLDHLAYALAANFTKPITDKIAEDSQFPIVGDEDRRGQTGQGPKLFGDQSFRLAGVDPSAKAVIQGLQPYMDGERYREHPLWILRELSNVDKHRLPHLVLNFSGGLRFTPSELMTDADLQMFPARVTRDTPIATAKLRHLQHVDVKGIPLFAVSLYDGPPVRSGSRRFGRHAHLPSSLVKIYNYIATQVFPTLAPFL